MIFVLQDGGGPENHVMLQDGGGSVSENLHPQPSGSRCHATSV